VPADSELAEAGEAAVAVGRVGSANEWSNQALAAQARRHAQLEQLAAAVSDYEREFGEISVDEIELSHT